MKDLFKIYQGILNWLYETIDSGVIITDTELNIKIWNKWLENNTKLNESELHGKKLFDVFPDLVSRKLDAYYNSALKGESNIIPYNLFNYLLPIPIDEGDRYKYMHQNVMISPLIFEHKVIGTITCITDITCHRMIEEQSKANIRAKEDWEMTFNSVPDLIAILDTQYFITKMNKAMADRLGVKIEDVVGKPCYEVVHSLDAPPTICPYKEFLHDGKAHSIDIYEKNLKGYFHVSVVPFYDENKNLLGSVHIAHDITERIKTEQLLKNLSLIDDLTGIYNRRGFMTLTEQLMKTADRLRSKMLLLFIDLNDMKYINDTLGHLEGDRALKDTASILRNTFREADIIGRYGGDEFIVSALQTGYINPDTITERLNENIALHNDEAKRDYNISLSIGMALYDPDAPYSLEDLISQADDMMYENKYKHKRISNNHR